MDDVVDVGVPVESFLTMPAAEPMSSQGVNLGTAVVTEMGCTESCCQPNYNPEGGVVYSQAPSTRLFRYGSK